MIDPVEMARGATAADYLRRFRMTVGTEQITYDATASMTPSKRKIGFDLPRVGLASRVIVGIDADFTAVEAAAAGVPAPSGLAPYNAVQNAAVKIGGSGSLVDLSGVGCHFLNDMDGSVSSEAFQAQPWPVAAAPFDTQHLVYAWNEATLPPKVIGHARWGYVLPFSITAGQPLGMILLGTDRTLARVELTFADLNEFVRGAAAADPALTQVTVTVTVSFEFFEVPSESAYGAYVRPLLRYAHRLTEDKQDVISVGAGSNIVQLLPYDGILQIAQYHILNGVLNVSAIEAARLRLNRSVIRDELSKETMWKQQREELGRDLPAIVWNYFSRESLRSAIRAGDYSDIRTEIDLAAGTVIAAGDSINTITRKLVDLGASAG